MDTTDTKRFTLFLERAYPFAGDSIAQSSDLNTPIHFITRNVLGTYMEPLAQYFDLAKQDVDPSNGHSLNEAMLNVAIACARVGEIAVGLEDALLRAEAKARTDVVLTDVTISEAKLTAAVKYMTMDERRAFREADTCHKGLQGKFKALQSALSFLKAELRT